MAGNTRGSKTPAVLLVVGCCLAAIGLVMMFSDSGSSVENETAAAGFANVFFGALITVVAAIVLVTDAIQRKRKKPEGPNQAPDAYA